MSPTTTTTTSTDPTPTNPLKPLSSYKLLSFDVYGTLIDWETGITTALLPLLTLTPSFSTIPLSASDLGGLFNAHEKRIQARVPGMLYSAVLREAYLATAKEIGVDVAGREGLEGAAERFARGVGGWAAFPDTVDAMERLGKRFKLVALSNTDHACFDATLAQALEGKVHFDGAYLAQDIGSYKPSLRNYHYMLDKADKEFGIKKEEVLVVARSLAHDHVPAKELGLSSVWIDRGGVMGGDAEELCEQGKVGFGWHAKTLGKFADMVEEEAEGSKV